MTISHETVVVGAGFAGLAASIALAEREMEHVVLERDRIGESWRSQRWDTFRLNTVRSMSGLAGDGFAPAAELLDELERRASGLPVRTGVAVERISRTRSGRFSLSTTGGTITARNVIAASGASRVPRLPAVAYSVMARGVEHLHSSDYRTPAALPDGGVLVVGSGQSGVQIADELLRAGRRVLLSTSKVGRMPRRYRGRDTTEWLRDAGFFDEAGAVAQPEAPPQVGAGHSISLGSLARGGAVLLGRLLGADDARLAFGDELGQHVRYADAVAERIRRRCDAWIAANGIAAPSPTPEPADVPLGPMSWPRHLNVREAGITSIIWATGFGGDFGWLTMPILRPDGMPYQRGGVTASEGLFTVGVPQQTRRSSAMLLGMERDAAAIADRVAERSTSRVRQSVSW